VKQKLMKIKLRVLIVNLIGQE